MQAIIEATEPRIKPLFIDVMIDEGRNAQSKWLLLFQKAAQSHKYQISNEKFIYPQYMPLSASASPPEHEKLCLFSFTVDWGHDNVKTNSADITCCWNSSKWIYNIYGRMGSGEKS